MSDAFAGQTILVTGGAGFIGSHLVRRLAAVSRARIVVTDKMTYAARTARIQAELDSGRVELVRLDLADAAATTATVAQVQPDLVLHLAAESHVDRSLQDPRLFFMANTIGSLNLAEACRAIWSNSQGKRFVYVSTDEVLGAVSEPDQVFDEQACLSPSNPYSASKAAGECIFTAWRRTYGFPVIITRSSNVFGTWQYPEKLLPLMIRNALDGVPLPVYGDGQQQRVWLHVDDVVDAFLRIAAVGEIGRIYHVSSRFRRANLAMVHLVCDRVDAFLGRPCGQTRQLIQFVADRPGHDRYYGLDASRTERELGWRATRTPEAEIDGLIAWYAAHRDWMRLA